MKHTEAGIQIAIIDALRWRGIMAVHIANEGRRSVVAGRRLKQQGMRPGFPDLALYGPGGRHMLMEVKAPKGRVSEAQAECIAELQARGVHVAVVRSIDDALAAVAEWPAR